MAGTLPLNESESSGIPKVKGTHPRICERCRVNIDDRHKNSRFCIDCGDKKRKPHVICCRLSTQNYKKFKAKLNGKTKQEILENLIFRYLSTCLVISLCIFSGCLSGNNEPPEGFDSSRSIKFVAESFGSKTVFSTEEGQLVITFNKGPHQDGAVFCFLASLNEDRCRICYYYDRNYQFMYGRPKENYCEIGKIYIRATRLDPGEEYGSLIVAWRK